MIALAIVEDNTDLRNALVATLAAEDDFAVLGHAATAERALKSFDWPSINAALIDLDLPGTSGIELTAILKALHPHVAILVNTIYEDKETVFAALRNGASGYLLKGDQASDIPGAVRNLLSGGCPISPTIARWIIENFQSNPPSAHDAPYPSTPAADAQTLLTQREFQILQLLSEGFLYKEIAELIGVSAHTVHSHVRKIYSKLSASGRANALKRAKLLGFL